MVTKRYSSQAFDVSGSMELGFIEHDKAGEEDSRVLGKM